MISLELVFSAVGLPSELIHRWIELNKPVLSLVGAAVVSDTLDELESLRVVRVPPQERFDLGRLNNAGLRSSEARVVVKTDIDIAFSHQLINYLWKTVLPGTAVIAKCANIDADEDAEWGTKPIRVAGRGACFAMCQSDWHRLRGYNEHFEGWSADDDDLFKRASEALEVIQTAEYPLWHINHPKRIDARFPNRRDHNLAIMRSETWQETEDSKNWGLEKL